MTDPKDIAWLIEARDNRAAAHAVFVETRDYDEFVDKAERNVVVGAKGMGKTRLLEKKFKYLRTHKDAVNAIFLPLGDDKIELMAKVAFTFTHEAVRNKTSMLASVDWWELVWTISIGTVALYHSKVEFINSGIWAHLSLVDRWWERAPTERPFLYVHAVLQAIVAAQLKNEELTTILASLRPSLGNIDKPVYLFIDNIDEAFQVAGAMKEGGTESDFGTDAAIAEPFIDSLGSEFSLIVQIGLLATVRVLNGCKNLHVYAALRIEAIDKRVADLHPMAQQERALCVELSCTKEMARSIFEANLMATREADCCCPEITDNPYVRVVGFDAMPFLDEHGQPEPLFDFIYRHTLGRPRDLIEVGAAFVSIFPEDRSHDAIRDSVYQCANKCLKYYESFMLPNWDRRYEKAYVEFGTNILSESEIIKISDQLGRLYQLKDPISYFVNRGLLGTLNRHKANQMWFRSPSRYIGARPIDVSQSKYYFVHPVLVGAVQRADNRFQIDRSIIVGPGSPFDYSVESESLYIGGTRIYGLAVEFDGRTVLPLCSETNEVAPFFASVACAVWRLRKAKITRDEWVQELQALMRSQIWRGVKSGRLVDHLASRRNGDGPARDDESFERDLIQKTEEVHFIFSRHLDRQVAAPLSYADGTFEFHLCAPHKVDCSGLVEEVKKLGNSIDADPTKVEPAFRTRAR